MKSMKSVIERLKVMLDPEQSRISPRQKRAAEYMLNQANARQRLIQKHKRSRRRMAEASRRANRP